MKNLFPVVLMFLSTCVFADEMQFITVLSTPVGSFNRLEAVDPSAPAQGATVNFCTKIGTEGRVQLKGNNNVGIENTNLSPNTTLGRSSAGDYVLQKITLNSAGSVTGSRLLSNVVKVSGQGVGKSDNLYGDTLTVAGAKTTGLDVGNGKSKMSGTGSAPNGMVWSNEYQEDIACKEGSSYEKCKKQYLLKQFGGAVIEDTDETCQAAGMNGTSEAYCAQYGLFPKNPLDAIPLSSSNCCTTCELLGGVTSGGECLEAPWTANGDEVFLGLKYANNSSTITLRQDYWDRGTVENALWLNQYGYLHSSCDFSGFATIPMEEVDNFDEAKFKQKCGSCGENDTCSFIAYQRIEGGPSGDWDILYRNNTEGGKDACVLLNTETLANVKNSNLRFTGNQCGDLRCGLGDLCEGGKDYSYLKLSISNEQRRELDSKCNAYLDREKNGHGCLTATGIPSSAYDSEYSHTFGVAGGVSDCKVGISVSGTTVWGAAIKKWKCVRNPNAGRLLFGN